MAPAKCRLVCWTEPLGRAPTIYGDCMDARGAFPSFSFYFFPEFGNRGATKSVPKVSPIIGARSSADSAVNLVTIFPADS